MALSAAGGPALILIATQVAPKNATSVTAAITQKDARRCMNLLLDRAFDCGAPLADRLKACFKETT